MSLMDNGTSLGSSPFPASARGAGGPQLSEPLGLNRKYLGFSEVNRCEKPLLVQANIKVNNFFHLEQIVFKRA